MSFSLLSHYEQYCMNFVIILEWNPIHGMACPQALHELPGVLGLVERLSDPKSRDPVGSLCPAAPKCGKNSVKGTITCRGIRGVHAYSFRILWLLEARDGLSFEGCEITSFQNKMRWLAHIIGFTALLTTGFFVFLPQPRSLFCKHCLSMEASSWAWCLWTFGHFGRTKFLTFLQPQRGLIHEIRVWGPTFWVQGFDPHSLMMFDGLFDPLFDSRYVLNHFEPKPQNSDWLSPTLGLTVHRGSAQGSMDFKCSDLDNGLVWVSGLDLIWFGPESTLLAPRARFFFLRKYEFERIFAARTWPWLPLTEITLENGSMLMTHDHRFTILSHRLISSSSSSSFHIIMWYYNYDFIFCPTYDSIFSSQCRAAVEVDESWSSMTLQERQGRTSRD